MVEWIEIMLSVLLPVIYLVSTLVVEWIEINLSRTSLINWIVSPPSWWSGLKFLWPRQTLAIPKSPPSWWSGLKYI